MDGILIVCFDKTAQKIRSSERYRRVSGWTVDTKGLTTLCVQSTQYRTRSSEIAFLRTVLVWLSTCISYQLNIVSDYAITQYRTNASEIAHLVRIVCSGLNSTNFPVVAWCSLVYRMFIE